MVLRRQQGDRWPAASRAGLDVGINAGVSGFDLGSTIVMEAAGGQRLL